MPKRNDKWNKLLERQCLPTLKAGTEGYYQTNWLYKFCCILES